MKFKSRRKRTSKHCRRKSVRRTRRKLYGGNTIAGRIIGDISVTKDWVKTEIKKALEAVNRKFTIQSDGTKELVRAEIRRALDDVVKPMVLQQIALLREEILAPTNTLPTYNQATLYRPPPGGGKRKQRTKNKRRSRRLRKSQI